MKICHVINSLNRGGAESHLLELAKAQNNEGLLIDIVVIGKDNKNIFSIEQELIKCCNNIFRLNGPRMFNLFSYFKLKNLIKNNEYDIIHSHQPRSDYMIHILKKYFFLKTLFKWIVSIHGKYDSYLENNYKKVFKLYFFKKLLKSWTFADSVIVISHEVESWLKNLTEKIQPYVINYWISIKEHRNINQNQNLTIGFLGRLNKNKGIEDLIKSLNNLPIQFNFVIGGHGSDSYIGYLKDQMTSELLEKTTFLGYIEDQSKFFEGIDIFVFPSYSEGLGLVLLEAMSYQKICITRNLEPMNQFINENNGYLFSKNNDLKDAILNASYDLNNEKIYLEKIKNIKKVLEIYDIKNVFPKILEVYKL